MSGEKKAAQAATPETAHKVLPQNAPIVVGTDDDNKQIATLKAQLALRGFVVHEVRNGGFMVGRWDRTMYCPRPDDLAAFARRVGACA